jgi:hypothetical protein
MCRRLLDGAGHLTGVSDIEAILARAHPAADL